MQIYIGADHRGFDLKEKMKVALKEGGYDVVDVGSFEKNPDDDYPDVAGALAEKVASGGPEARGIVICGSGFGVDIVANKFKGIRSGLAMSPDHIRVGRHDDDVNVLALSADFVPADSAIEMAKIFLTTPFGPEERRTRRTNKIIEIENKK